MSVRLWSLNRATSLLNHGRPDPRIGAIFDGCEWGRRDGAINRDGSDDGHRLMHQGGDDDDPDRRNEYWVPIALKCLGDWHDPDRLPPGRFPHLNADLLRRIAGHYAYFRDRRVFEGFWDPAAPHGVVMNTHPCVGYYELLLSHPDNVLVGYSQGGLVARYLAFLDEHVFGARVVRGIVTVASPNHGSPLANPANREQVADGMLKVLLALVSLHREQGARRLTSIFGNLSGKIDFNHLYEMIGELHDELTGLPDRSAAETSVRSALATALKWLSGLDDPNQRLPYSAFDDLDATTCADPDSVLGLVEAWPLTHASYGAVIGGDSRLDDLFGAVGGWKYSLARWFSKGVRRNVEEAGAAYADGIMAEVLGDVDAPAAQAALRRWPGLAVAAQDPAFRRGVERYAAGWDVPPGPGDAAARLPPQAHDFIIPSHSQALPAGAGLLGNLVNPKANHDTGKSRAHPGGEHNYHLIARLLKRLARRLR